MGTSKVTRYEQRQNTLLESMWHSIVTLFWGLISINELSYLWSYETHHPQLQQIYIFSNKRKEKERILFQSGIRDPYVFLLSTLASISSEFALLLNSKSTSSPQSDPRGNKDDRIQVHNHCQLKVSRQQNTVLAHRYRNRVQELHYCIVPTYSYLS